jgi:outer membrane protein assembly factor BamA
MRYTAWVVGLLCFFMTGVLGSQDSKPGEPSLVVEGNKVFSEKELLDVANKCLAEGSRARDKYEPSAVEYCLWKVKLFLNSKGYLQATVGTPQERRTEGSALLVVSIHEGALYRIGEIRIRGSKIFSPAQLLQMSSFKPGDIAGGDAIGEWLFEGVKKAYANLGYIEYMVEAEPELHAPAAGTSEGVVDLTVTIEEGRAFILRSIKFEGNGNIPTDVLQSILLVRDREIFSKERFDESIKRLNQLRLFEEIDADKDVNYKSDNESPELDITIHLKKRPQFQEPGKTGST